MTETSSLAHHDPVLLDAIRTQSESDIWRSPLALQALIEGQTGGTYGPDDVLKAMDALFCDGTLIKVISVTDYVFGRAVVTTPAQWASGQWADSDQDIESGGIVWHITRRPLDQLRFTDNCGVDPGFTAATARSGEPV